MLLLKKMRSSAEVKHQHLGILAAFAGLWVASAAYIDSFWLTFIIQIFIATVLVAITAFLFRKSSSG